MILGTDIILLESAFSPCLPPAQEADKLPAGTSRLHQHHHGGLNGHCVTFHQDAGFEVGHTNLPAHCLPYIMTIACKTQSVSDNAISISLLIYGLLKFQKNDFPYR